jgi:hypothetical protein
MKETGEPQEAVKDENATYPISSAWRATLRDIVESFVQGDYALSRGLHSVAPVPPATAEQIKRYIAGYGETLVALPDETWETSVSQWMGTHWDVLVDLWTLESGESDMVLSARVFEMENGFRSRSTLYTFREAALAAPTASITITSAVPATTWTRASSASAPATTTPTSPAGL